MHDILKYMNEQQTQLDEAQTVEGRTDWKQEITTVTPLSKHLAMILFIILPFAGFWLGMKYGGTEQRSEYGDVFTSSDLYFPEPPTPQPLELFDVEYIPPTSEHDISTLTATNTRQYRGVGNNGYFANGGFITMLENGDFFFFKDELDAEGMPILEGPSDYSSDDKFYIYRSKIYTHDGGYIYTIDPFSGYIEGLPNPHVPEGAIIHSMYIVDSVLYYLVILSPQQCPEAKFAPCAGELYAMWLDSSATSTRIAQTSLSGRIIGYVEDEQAWYISQGWGDAGCATSRIIKIVDGSEQPVGDYGGCWYEVLDVDPEIQAEQREDNKKYLEMEEVIKAIEQRSGQTNSKWIKVENGKYLPANKAQPSSELFKYPGYFVMFYFLK
jgi:hypothetical protein